MTDPAILPRVAREAIRADFEGRPPRLPPPPPGPSRPVFVTLKVDGRLRGCMGELEAQRTDLVQETADRALAAAFGDPRFPPLTPEELDRCEIEVTILGPLEPVHSLEELDPKVYGIEVADALGRRAVLLPDLEGVDTVAEQVALTRRKAGIPDDEPISIRRFRATRIAEQG